MNTLERIHEVLHQVFDLAVEDEYIRKNPSDKVMGELKRALNYDTPKRYALTREQENAFMNYIKAAPAFRHWLPLFMFFLREPILIPPFSCHNLRHTFCTRLWENGVNAKMVQDIMGYADFSTAVDVREEVTAPVAVSTAGVAQAIQSIMGHADYNTTMDIYTDVSMDAKERALSAVADRIGL